MDPALRSAMKKGYFLENPFGTAEGQSPVSITESFWARLIREGRPLNKPTSGTALSSGSLSWTSGVTASKGCLFYPKHIVVSADVDGMLAIRIDTKLPKIGTGSDGIIAFYAYAKAGNPLKINFDGELFCLEDGTIQIGMNPSTNGNLYGSIYGVEVAI